MRQENPHYRNLLLGYISNTISAAEVKELYDFIQQEPEQYALLMEEPEVLFRIGTDLSPLSAEVEERFRQRIEEAVEHAVPVKHIVKRAWSWYAAAAAIIICLGTAAYFWITNAGTRKGDTTGNDQPLADVPPGKNGAVLTLANSSAIVLDSLGNGVVTTEGKTTLRIDNGKLVYDAPGNQQEALYNTTTTPNGRQFSLVLADGSKAWLNAGSSITYPTVFTGNERTVTITGEVYFEVSKDRSKPFHVKVNDMDVEVLGTHFNINSYADEADIKTTLLEGKIKVSKNGKNSLLEPGQQAIANKQQLKVISNANVAQATAWKNGFFNFDRSNLKTVMNQLARWYDIEVKYAENLPPRTFRGKIPRDQPLSQVLFILQDVGIKFQLQRKTLMVTH